MAKAKTKRYKVTYDDFGSLGHTAYLFANSAKEARAKFYKEYPKKRGYDVTRVIEVKEW